MIRSLRFLLVCGLVIAALFATIQSLPSVNADPPELIAGDVEPVEDDMHEFMEYLFQPTYKRLKVSMAEEPADKKGWKAIKSDALILAEGGNLLLAHVPDTDGADWTKHSVVVRRHGGDLYRAAKAKDYAKATGSYRLMIEHCNACHKQFENGKHILEP